MMKKFASGCLFFLIFSRFFLTAQSKGHEGDVHFHPIGYVAEGCWKFYHNFITDQDASRCPYELSCSKYMAESVKIDGIPGIVEGFDRLNRCSRYENRIELYARNEKGLFVDNPGDVKQKSIEIQNYLLKAEAAGMEKAKLKSRGTAVALSFVLPGAGQIYLGNYGRGAREFLVTGVFAGAAAWSVYKYGIKNWRPWVYGTMAAGTWLVDIYGAGTEAVRMNYAAVFGNEVGGNAAAPEGSAGEAAGMAGAQGAAGTGERMVSGTTLDSLCMIKNALRTEDFDQAEELFVDYVEENPFAFDKNQLQDFQHCLNAARNFSGKSVMTARVLSVIPGLGQLYAHQWQDGVNAFVLDGALLAVSAYSLVTLNFVDFFVLEMNPTVRFYRGNFINAGRDVVEFNKQQRQKILEPVYEMLH